MILWEQLYKLPPLTKRRKNGNKRFNWFNFWSINCNQTSRRLHAEKWLAFITYQKHFQSKLFTGETAKEDAIRWRLIKEKELYGEKKAPQKHLFNQYLNLKGEQKNNEED